MIVNRTVILGVLLALAGVCGCAPTEQPAVEGVTSVEVKPPTVVAPADRDPRLVEIHRAVTAGEPVPLSEKVLIHAGEAEFSADGQLVLKQVTFESLATGERTLEFLSASLFAGDEIQYAGFSTGPVDSSDIKTIFNVLLPADDVVGDIELDDGE